jgi:hypothetical protein
MKSHDIRYQILEAVTTELSICYRFLEFEHSRDTTFITCKRKRTFWERLMRRKQRYDHVMTLTAFQVGIKTTIFYCDSKLDTDFFEYSCPDMIDNIKATIEKALLWRHMWVP